MTRLVLRPWLPWLSLAGITVLGGVLRLAWLASLPPGQFLDESLVSVIARNLAANHEYPVYIGHTGGGYHPAVIYLTRLARWVLSGHPFAARYGVASVSALSLPLIFLALRAIFELDAPRPRAAWLALLATLVVAGSVPYTIISRTASEMTLTTPLAALTFLSLAAGLRCGSRRWYLWAGVGLGLSLYTYYSARLLPLGVAGAVLGWRWIEQRSSWRAPFGALALIAATALMVSAPLGLCFLRHPCEFTERALTASQALREGPWPMTLAASAVRTLAGLVWPGAGDALARPNVPGRPFFDAFTALLLVLGAISSRREWRRSRVLLLAWSLALLLPTILTPEGNSPHFTRLIAATPALAGLVAVGGLALAQTLNRAVYPAGAIVLALGLCFSMAASAYTFFGRWAALPDLYEAFMVQDWRAANWALEQSRTATVYISPELVSDPFHASFDLLLRGGPVRDFPGAGCLLYPDRASRPLAYLTFVPRDPVTTDQVAALYPTGQALAPILRQPDAQVEYTRFQVPAGAASMPPAQPADAVFGDALRLVGFELDPPQARAGETIHITLYWQALAAPLPEYVMFVHLYAPVPEGPSQPPLAQHDGAPCNQAWSTTRLAAGERVIDTRAVTIPTVHAGTKAVLAVGVYAWPSQVRLPVTGATPQLPDNRIVLSDVSIVRD